MQKYEVEKTLGTGAFGDVYQACLRDDPREHVAIKKIKQKYKSWKECLHLRELASLKVLRHNNIVRLKEMILEKELLHFVFEFCDGNLYEEMQKNKFSRERIQVSMRQIFAGISYMHKQGYFHRDMKPENVLIKNGVLKLADFGLAREVRSRPPYTQYVSTRWYRAPELLLRSPTYNSPVDMWACGAIMAELFMNVPLFAGQSEVDMLMKIFGSVGAPNKQSWPDGVPLLKQRGITTLPSKIVGLESVTKNQLPADAMDLMRHCMLLDPSRRCSGASALKHPFLNVDDVTIQRTVSSCSVQQQNPDISGPAKQADSKTSESKTSKESNFKLDDTVDTDDLNALLDEMMDSKR
jgi:serine/threonine protein kinase